MFERHLVNLQKECEPGYWPACAGIVKARQDYEDYGFCFSMGDWNRSLRHWRHLWFRQTVRGFQLQRRVSVMTRKKLMQDFGPKLVALRDKVLEITEAVSDRTCTAHLLAILACHLIRHATGAS